VVTPARIVIAEPVWSVPGAARRLPATYSRDFAPARPAPPSGEPTMAPPRPRPEVTESRRSSQAPPEPGTPGLSRSYYDAYTLAGAAPATGNATVCSVSFWNLSPGPVTLRVNDRAYTLERGRQLTLDLPRQFQWRLDPRDPEHAQVPDGQPGLEIVVRR
jgi:hypothetical protein